MSAILIVDTNEYFKKAVEEAFSERNLDSGPYIKNYVVEVLKHYLFVENLYDEQDEAGKKTRKTLAEMLLTANQLSAKERFEKLKKLGDSSLYISGFFSDSFQRKIIDIDYYVDVGRMAFESLAHDVDEDTFAHLYREISEQFLSLVDVLALISQKAKIMDEENILRMMDVYSKTGSSLLGETLAEKGVFNRPGKRNIKQ